jgi:hypothetical protein
VFLVFNLEKHHFVILDVSLPAVSLKAGAQAFLLQLLTALQDRHSLCDRSEPVRWMELSLRTPSAIDAPLPGAFFQLQHPLSQYFHQSMIA